MITALEAWEKLQELVDIEYYLGDTAAAVFSKAVDTALGAGTNEPGPTPTPAPTPDPCDKPVVHSNKYDPLAKNANVEGS